MNVPARLRPGFARLGAATLLAAGLTVVPTVGPTGPGAHPVPPSVTTMAVSGIDAAAAREVRSQARLVALTARQATRPFMVMGLTWTGPVPEGFAASVRVRSAGQWGPWQELHADPSHAPDPESAEAQRSRNGTEPLVVGRADGVQVRVDGDTHAPSRLRAVLVDPGTSPADALDATRPPAGLSAATAAAVRPTIRTRADWGADESLRQGPPSYGTIRTGFVHHTAGSNSYTQSDVPAIIRGIYAFHVQGRGWNDIGYNFLVDKWGRMWEGRFGGVGRPVIGAHTSGFNDQSFAMATLGDFTSTAPSSAVVTSYAELFAWKLGLKHLDPTTSTVLSDADGPRELSRVSGHRDANSTTCPGQLLYAAQPAIRSGAKSRQGTMFYRPDLRKRSWVVGGAGTYVRGQVSKAMTWRVRVRNACTGTLVSSQSGTSTATTGLTARWNARLSATGGYAPPGYYRLEVTASSGTGPLDQARSWAGTVRIDRADGSLPTRCP